MSSVVEIVEKANLHTLALTLVLRWVSQKRNVDVSTETKGTEIIL